MRSPQRLLLLAGALLAMGLLARAGQAQVRSTAVMGLLDLQNSTMTSLSSSGGLNSTFLGRGTEVRDYAAVNVWGLVSQNSAPNGLQLQWSGLASDQGFSTLASYSLSSYTAFSATVPEQARWFRLLYTNGVVSLTSISLQVIHRPLPATVLVSFAPGTFAFGPSGSLLVSGVGLGSFSTGFSNTVLMSNITPPWRGTTLSSMYISTLGPNNGLGSVQLIRGRTGTSIAIYHLLTTQGGLGSIGLYNDADSPISTFTGLVLWSQEFAAQGGAQMNPFGGGPKPTEYFRAQLGSSVWGMVLGSFGVHWTILYSYEAP